MKYVVTFFLCLLLICFAEAQIPNKISYQGLLTTPSGTPLQDGSYDLKFEIYNLPTAGTLRHTETHSGVTVERGTFSLNLGPLPAIFSESLFVEVTILAGPGISSPMTFAPRSVLTSAPYAFRADTAQYAFSTSGQWSTNGSNIYYNTGNVGIGKSSPSYKLDVNGIVNATDIYKNGLPFSGSSQWTTSGSDIYYNLGKVGIGTTPTLSKVTVSVDGLAPYSVNSNVSMHLVRQGPHNLIMERRSLHTGVLFCGESSIGLADDGMKIEFRTGVNTGDPSNTGYQRMVINTNGNVGIGTASPSYKLDVNGIVNATDIYKNGLPFSGSSQWTTNGSNVYFNGGNVGIGYSNPYAKLMVSGSNYPSILLVADDGTNANLEVRSFGVNEPNGGNSYSLYCDGVAHTGDFMINENYINGVFNPTPRFSVQNETGNVGIGTTSPATKADVNGTIRTTGITAPLTSGAGLEMYYSSDAGTILSFDRSATQPKDLYLGSRNTYFQTKTFGVGVGDMLINSNGNVGIGTTSPQQPLHIQASDAVIRLTASGTGGREWDVHSRMTDGDFRITDATAGIEPRLIINSTGNVGIGTTTPDANAKLDVNGYAFAKAPVVVYDSAAGSGTSFDITWLNDVRIDNNIVEKQANNYEFMLKKAGWYRISLFVYVQCPASDIQYGIIIFKNGIGLKIIDTFVRNPNAWWYSNGNVIVQSNGSDIFKIIGSSVSTFSVVPSWGSNQLSIEYLGAE